MRAREGHFIREHGTLNKAINGRTPKEWYNDNQERIQQYQQTYKKQQQLTH